MVRHEYGNKFAIRAVLESRFIDRSSNVLGDFTILDTSDCELKLRYNEFLYILKRKTELNK